MSKAQLKLDWCTHEAAKYAVEHWHYSKRMPMPPLVKIGAWEDGKYVGCILFSRGASPHLGTAYGLTQTECCELTRVALTSHATPVSRALALSVRFLRRTSPGLRLIVSFADTAEGHHGGIYQGAGWTYTGLSTDVVEYFHEGRWKHTREMIGGAFGGAAVNKSIAARCPTRTRPGKHRYLLPLDAAMRAQVAPLAKPYPKRVQDPRVGKSSPVGTTTGEGGALPTPTL